MIGKEIRERRKKARMTIEDLTDALGYGWFPSKIAKIEREEQEITAAELYEIMRALQIEQIYKFSIVDYERPVEATV